MSTNYTELESAIIDLLLNGRNEINPEKAKKHFDEAGQIARKNIKESDIIKSLYFEAQIELGSLEDRYEKRNFLWEEILRKIKAYLEETSSENFLNYCCDTLNMYANVQYLEKDFILFKDCYLILKNKIDNSIISKGVENSSSLLAKKASILRNFSNFQSTDERKRKMAEEAIRCIDKANALENTWFSLLERGRCHWNYSKFEKFIYNYNNRIKEAENSIYESQNLCLTVQNTLALCYLFRSTYQTMPFFVAFKKYEEIELDKRRFLENSILLAEAAISMYYANAPKEVLNDYLAKAERILDEAILAGYHNARSIIDLAFVKAARGEINIGEKILKTLKSGDASFDWNIIVEDIKTLKDSNSLFEQGFVLGINNSSVWNKLGTFAIDFLDDISLGIKMYEVAYHFNPMNAVVLTNLSRALLKTDLNEKILADIDFYISRAQSKSTFRFQWWRYVKEEYSLAKTKLTEKEPINRVKNNYNFTKLADLYKFYKDLKKSENPQDRGFQFEKLIKQLLNVSLGNSFGSHRIKSDLLKQIDAAFFFEKEFYRVEAKWTAQKVDHKDIAAFNLKLNTKGVSGLIISINGFTESAIQCAKNLKNEVMVLLMDGEEIEATLQGSPAFDEAIKLKQLYFCFQDNPYYKVTVNNQDRMDCANLF